VEVLLEGSGSNEAWTTRSAIVAMPKRYSFPPVLEIILSCTGNGRKLRFFTCNRSSPRKSQHHARFRRIEPPARPPRPCVLPCLAPGRSTRPDGRGLATRLNSSSSWR
jgi:hypothetical protein